MVRLAVLGFAAISFLFGIAYPLLVLQPATWTTVADVLAWNGLGVLLVGRALNVDAGSSVRDAFSRHCHRAELAFLAAPADALADWQALAEHLRFAIDWLQYDPTTGELALLARRVRLFFGWPQYLVVRGSVAAAEPSTFAVVVDSIIPVRLDFDDNRTAVERIVRHFARAPEPVR